jgi:hypothetical protein
MRVFFPEGAEIFLFPTVSRIALEPTGYWVSFPGGKAPGYEADLSSPSSAKVKNAS